MTTLDDLVRLLEESPSNPIIAAMFVDEAMEVRDMQRSEADAVLAKIQRTGFDAQNIRAATALLAAGSRSCRHLLTAVYRECHVPRSFRPTVFVTNGDFVVVSDAFLSPDLVRYWGGVVILAGAQWLLKAHAAHCEHVRLLRRASRIRRSRR